MVTITGRPAFCQFYHRFITFQTVHALFTCLGGSLHHLANDMPQLLSDRVF